MRSAHPPAAAGTASSFPTTRGPTAVRLHALDREAARGIKTPVKQPAGGVALAADNQAYNALHRATRCRGERGFALLTGRWGALQRITVSPSRIGELTQAALVLTRIENVQLRTTC